jgi:hypothetical protein
MLGGGWWCTLNTEVHGEGGVLVSLSGQGVWGGFVEEY